MDGALDGAISSGLSSAVYGTDFLEGFSSSMVNTLVNLTLADVQFEIGELGVTYDASGNRIKNANWEGSLPHALLHGLAGCAAGAVQNGGQGCAAGAAGGLAQSLYAGIAKSSEPKAEDYSNPNDFLSAQAAWRSKGLRMVELYSAVAGYFFSGGEGGNVSLASQVGTSAFRNNYLSHDQFSSMIEAFENCEGDTQCMRDVLGEYRVLSLEQEHELALCGSDLSCMAKHLPDLAGTLGSGQIGDFFSDSDLLKIDDPVVQDILRQINAIQEVSLASHGDPPPLNWSAPIVRKRRIR
ncbi:DUF637 domain-containing protein, partial [Roseibium sediminis]|uniref:DUF637 domain-containing protein n=1 Tax=Roseibium sediminis TaxID=1775174 RepID=UPI0024536055